MAVLRVQVFGKLSIACDGNHVASFPTRSTEELLGYLLLNQEAEHSREKLIELLWPQSSIDRARAQFSTTLWRVRGAFSNIGVSADAFIRSSRDWVAFSPQEPVQLDARYFERWVKRGRQASDAPARVVALEKAVAVYRGDLFEGHYANWCLLERERYARLFLRALGQLMNCYMQLGDHEAALEIGSSILERDFLREEVHRAMMYCYWNLGRREKAIRQFHLCTRELEREFRIAPMPETVALYRQIVLDRWRGATHKVQSSERASAFWKAFARFEEAGLELNRLLDDVEAE